MMYFQKLLNLASYPEKSPCVLFFIVEKNLFLSPLCYHQIKLSSQMDGESRRPLADCWTRTGHPSPGRPGGRGCWGGGQWRAWGSLAGGCAHQGAVEICCRNGYLEPNAGSEIFLKCNTVHPSECCCGGLLPTEGQAPESCAFCPSWAASGLRGRRTFWADTGDPGQAEWLIALDTLGPGLGVTCSLSPQHRLEPTCTLSHNQEFSFPTKEWSVKSSS